VLKVNYFLESINTTCQHLRYDELSVLNPLEFMTQICPKCSYIRKESDTCPAWQCPSCQIAYTKAGDSTPTNTQGDQTSKSSQRAVTSIPASTWKLLIVFAIIAAIAWQSGLAFRKKATHRIVNNSTQSLQQPEVILYGTTWCGYCAAARQFFDANGIRYTEYDTEKTTLGYEGHKKLGGGGVPLIVVGGEVMHGYSEAGLRQALAPWIQATR
jgi:glutaredoxin